MATLAEVAQYDVLSPSELKRFGKRVKFFTPPENVGEEGVKQKYLEEVQSFIDGSGGQLYTGIHKENDWSRTFWWDKGAHLVNRTLEFAVITPH